MKFLTVCMAGLFFNGSFVHGSSEHSVAALDAVFAGKDPVPGAPVVPPGPPAPPAGAEAAQDAPTPEQVDKAVEQARKDGNVIVVEKKEERPPWYMRFLYSFDEALPKTTAAAIGGLLGWFIIEVGKVLLEGSIAIPWVGIVIAAVAGIALGFLAYYLLERNIFKSRKKDKKS